MTDFHSECDSWIGSCPLIEIRKQDEGIQQYQKRKASQDMINKSVFTLSGICLSECQSFVQ